MRLIVLLAFLMSGCMGNFPPDTAADFVMMGLRPPESAAEIETSLARRPAANLPAKLATFRLQASKYRDRDLDSRGEMEELGTMRGIKSVVPLKGREVSRDRDFGLDSIRSYGESARADLLLVYTFDTSTNNDTTIPCLGLFTLGIFPNEIAAATSTCSAALVDARTGHIYGILKATSRQHRITNAWNLMKVRNKSAEDARSYACRDLVGQVEQLWNGVLARYCPGYP